MTYPVQNKYKFSFVIPIYNTEDYLAEAIDSVIEQDIGFEENIELILVNDGSTDRSGDICKSYSGRFPDNIRYIEQSNLGASAAFNSGIKAASGKYVTVLGSDDKVSKDISRKVWEFFEDNYEQIDLVSVKLEYFEAMTGDHPLNYKYGKSRVIDIEENFDYVQLASGSVFLKAEVLQDGQLFDPKIRRFAEDVKFLTEIILEKCAYGVISGPTYFYRKREAKTSLIDISKRSKDWYMSTPNVVYRYLFEYSRNKLGYIPSYVQYIVMYDLQWRLKQKTQNVLTKGEEDQYRKSLYSLISEIDTEVIMMQRNLPIEYKLFCIRIKHGQDVYEHSKINGHDVEFSGERIYSYRRDKEVALLEIIEKNNSEITIEGHLRGLLFKDVTLQFKCDDKYYDIEFLDRPLNSVYFLSDHVFDRNNFKVNIPVKFGSSIIPYLFFKNSGKRKRIPVETWKRTRLSVGGTHAYRVIDDVIIIHGDNEILIQANSPKNRIVREIKRQLYLYKSQQYSLAVMRMLSILYNSISNRKIWLVSDRLNYAGDNGEAFFRYATEQNPRNTKIYFAISKTSPDYDRMRAYGNVIDRSGYWYKIIFLLADKVISSHADDFIINPFGDDDQYMMDMYKFEFVFLQHGITKDDISTWLNKYSKNIKLFISSARSEYESLLEKRYGYSEEIVKLTGFPRHDHLTSNPKGKLILAPTWRRSLVPEADGKTSNREYNSDFKKSEYFNFYHSLMSDQRILEQLKNHGMTGELYLHPSFISQIEDFEENELFSVKDMPYDYQQAFAEGNILITDYSSVAFDFAYLKKPVIYTQFDKDSFYDNHLYDSGYFSYEDNGFGPVAYNYDQAVDEIIRYLKSGCVMRKKYIERVDSFFYKFDHNNSKRVYEAVIRMSE